MNIKPEAHGYIIKLEEDKEIAFAWNGVDTIEFKIKCKAGDLRK